jgi:hypothetical protein
VGIKVARSKEVPSFSPLGTAQKVSMIDKERLQPTLCVFQEDRLTVVNVHGTNVNHPCQWSARLFLLYQQQSEKLV